MAADDARSSSPPSMSLAPSRQLDIERSSDAWDEDAAAAAERGDLAVVVDVVGGGGMGVVIDVDATAVVPRPPTPPRSVSNWRGDERGDEDSDGAAFALVVENVNDRYNHLSIS